MSTVQEHDPFKFAALKLYCKHRRFMSLNYHENFKLFASWYCKIPIVQGQELCAARADLPWYRYNWALTELAHCLNLSEYEVLGMLEEIHDDT